MVLGKENIVFKEKQGRTHGSAPLDPGKEQRRETPSLPKH